MAISPECYHRLHNACNCEDACSCQCHLIDAVLDEDQRIDDLEDEQMEER